MKFSSIWRNYKKNKAALAALFFILALIILALLADFISPYNPTRISTPVDPTTILAPLTPAHPMGTDEFGRDVLSRIIYGARISLLVGFLSGAIIAFLGVLAGLSAGYFRGKTDEGLMRLSDVFLIIPALPLILVVIYIFGSSLVNVIIIIGVLSWPMMARIVRAESLSLASKEFIEAERVMGASHKRIIFRHILPNILSPILVNTSISIGAAILLESGLSFLGLAPMTEISWGSILTTALTYVFTGAWWLAVFPGVMIFLTVLSFYLISDGLNEALNPQRRRS